MTDFNPNNRLFTAIAHTNSLARFNTYSLFDPEGNSASECLVGIEEVAAISGGNYRVLGNPPHYCALRKGQEAMYTGDRETKTKMRPLFNKLAVITGEMAFARVFDLEITVFRPFDDEEPIYYHEIIACGTEFYLLEPPKPEKP